MIRSDGDWDDFLGPEDPAPEPSEPEPEEWHGITTPEETRERARASGDPAYSVGGTLHRTETGEPFGKDEKVWDRPEDPSAPIFENAILPLGASIGRLGSFGHPAGLYGGGFLAPLGEDRLSLAVPHNTNEEFHRLLVTGPQPVTQSRVGRQDKILGDKPHGGGIQFQLPKGVSTSLALGESHEELEKQGRVKTLSLDDEDGREDVHRLTGGMSRGEVHGEPLDMGLLRSRAAVQGVTDPQAWRFLSVDANSFYRHMME